jgi:guanosine-3',5'-bis(diphosphate) 3'-pyrophosphohydrolase
MDPLTSAKAYAHLHHVERGRQMYGVLPYTHHLEAVERVLREVGIEDIDLLVAAWLHDVVEDTDVKLRDIVENFGDDVAALVGAVTNEPGENRKARAALTYPKIREVGPRAIKLKLADRIANCRTGGGSLKMYTREYHEFRRNLWEQDYAHDNQLNLMWALLDELMGYGRFARES